MFANIIKTARNTKTTFVPTVRAPKKSLFARWLHNYRSRMELANLPPHMLNDIGLTREAAQAEAGKAFYLD